MSESKSIKTISGKFEHKFKEKGSIFIGLSFPVESEIQTSELLIELRKKYYDATHVCYAYKLEGDIFKYSEGISCLNSNCSKGLVNTILIGFAIEFKLFVL